MIKLVTADSFKSMHRIRTQAGFVRRTLVEPVGVRKESVAAVEPLDDRTLRFTISTAAIDRDLDRIELAGWKLDNYHRNPVVLWGHNAAMPPVGKAIELSLDDQRLAAVVRFLPAEGYGKASAWADQTYKLIRDGWMSATSVGFRPLKWDFTDDPERGADDWWPGVDFHEQELVEFSIVTVPANPEALLEPPPLVEVDAPIAAAANLVELEARARRRRRGQAAMLGVHYLQPRESVR